MGSSLVDSLGTFVNSRIGVLVVGAILGALGLFTWQRQDWLFKQQYLQTQVLLDRRLDLIEKINTDVGTLIAKAHSISVPIIKGTVSQEQTNGSIRSYNEFQAHWFGVHGAYETLLAFYFSPEIAGDFKGVVTATMELDWDLGHLGERGGAQRAYEAAEQVRSKMTTWNSRVLKELAYER